MSKKRINVEDFIDDEAEVEVTKKRIIKKKDAIKETPSEERLERIMGRLDDLEEAMGKVKEDIAMAHRRAAALEDKLEACRTAARRKLARSASSGSVPSSLSLASSQPADHLDDINKMTPEERECFFKDFDDIEDV